MTTIPRGEPRATLADIATFAAAVFRAAGTDEATATAATRAMLHGTRFGVDSHGIRLLDQYVKEVLGGRVSGAPTLTFTRELGAVASLDAGHAHGARATYAAMDKAMALAETAGIGAVGIRNSAHFGAAGAYALYAAEQGFVGYATCNADSLVKLHGGVRAFHGTNPHAWAVPAPDGKHWFFDMATSAIPYNRVLLYRSLGEPLPAGTSADAHGEPTVDAHQAEMLMPLGDAYGYKGAGLAGVAEIFSAVLNGMELSDELPPMMSDDLSTPRAMGAFVMAIRRDAYAPTDTVDDGIARYLASIRGATAQPGETVMAPGEREWRVAADRDANGAPLDPATIDAFKRHAARYGLKAPPLRSAT